MPTVVLKPGRAKPLWMGHPWVFADSVARIDPGEGDASDSDWVRVVDAEGRTVGWGFYSPASALRVRLVTRSEESADPDRTLEVRVRSAAALRRRLFPDPAVTNAYRLVHAEGDGLPGLIVDRFGDWLVAQFAIRPVHARRRTLARVLLEATGARGLLARAGGYEKTEGIEREDEAFTLGAPVPDEVLVREERAELVALPVTGQKTGHYADQRENRRLVGSLARDLEVLDLFCGTGGFAVQALRHGARSALAVDGSERSLAAATKAARLNDVSRGFEAQCADATRALADLRAARRRFGLVIVDPPNFMPRKGPTRGAIKAYRELNVRALSRVEPGGFLATFSCSAKLGPEALLDVVRSASRECRRAFSILRELSAGPDHPVSPGLPEGRYLSGLLVRVGTP